MLDLYMDDPTSRARPTELDMAIVQMFEARFTASFVLEDLDRFANEPDDDLNYYRARVITHRMSIELARFRGMANLFVGSLDVSQKRAMSAMAPVAQKIFDLERATKPLRNYAAHPGCGVHGIASRAKRTNDDEPELEDKAIKSAHLIAMYVDCVMHKIPGCFRRALSKTFVGDLHVRFPRPGSFPDAIAAFKKANPAASLRFDRIEPKHAGLMSDLLWARNSLQLVTAAYQHISRVKLGSGKMTKPWVRIQRRKLAYYSQHAALETISFFDLYARLKAAGLVDHDDGVIKLLNRHEEKIRKLRQLVAHWEPGRDFTACVISGIGHERLLFVATLVGEWARINGNEYTERRGLGDIPELDQMNRRLALGRIEHEVGRMREEARLRGAGTPGPDCPQ